MGTKFQINPVKFITIGTVGPPGDRVFHLQAGDDEELITLIIEKEQARALANGLVQLLDEIDKKLDLPAASAMTASMDMELHEPILPLFRVAKLGLGYDEEAGMMVVMAEELLVEGESNEPSAVHFYATRDQLLALSEHTLEVVEKGRVICGNCGKPKDPEGHFCPQSNGHTTHAAHDQNMV